MKLIFKIIIFITTNIIFAQERSFNIPDSLKNKSFESLENLFYKSEPKSIEDSIYSNSFLKKAFNINDSVKIAKGFLLLTSTAKNEIDLEELVNNSIKFSEGKIDFFVPCTAYSLKANICWGRKNFREALDYFLLTHKSAKIGGNIELAYLTVYNMGLLKNEIAHHDETIKYMKEALNYFKDEKKYSLYLSSLCMISNSYTYKKELDSATVINLLGIKKSLNQKDEEHYWYFVFYEGINSFYKEKYLTSIDSLKKAIPFLKSSNNNYKVSIAYFYIGIALKKIHDYAESEIFLNKVDSMFVADNYLPIYCRETYNILSSYRNDKKLYYLNQLLILDSITNQNYKDISKTLYNKYETPKLKADKERLLKLHTKEKSLLNKYLIISAIIGLLISIGFGFNYFKRKNYQTKYEQLIIELESQNETEKVITATISDIDHEIVKRILKSLEKFENEKGFLNNKMTLAFLTKKVGTNTKYLSKILNTYKQKKYSDYINDLRIDYIVSELRTNKKIRKYTVDVISEEAGFNSRRAFSTAFLKKTGFSAYFFIKKLENDVDKI